MKTLINKFLADTGMTAAQLAKEAGTSKSTISRMRKSDAYLGKADSYIKVKNFIDNFSLSDISVLPDKRKKTAVN